MDNTTSTHTNLITPFYIAFEDFDNAQIQLQRRAINRVPRLLACDLCASAFSVI